MLRGEESYEDYLFVEQTCTKWGVAFEGTRVDVPAYMKKTGEEAQSLPPERYAMVFWGRVMKKYECTAVSISDTMVMIRWKQC